MDINVEVAEKFYRSMERWRKLHIGKAQHCDFSKSELSMLLHIKHCQETQEHVRTSDLTQQLKISKPAISQMLNVMEEKGLIGRSTDSEDRRLTNVVITEKGNEVLDNHMKRVLGFVGAVFEKMGSRDSHEFIRLVDLFFDCMTEVQKDVKESQDDKARS